MARDVPVPRARMRLELAGALLAIGLATTVALAAGLPDLVVAATVLLAVLVTVGVGFSELHGRRAELERLVRLYASLKAVASSTDVQAVLGTVAREAADALSAKECVVMYRRSSDLVVYPSSGSDVRPTATPLGHSAFDDDPAEQLPSVRVILTGEPVEITDIAGFEGPPGFQEACAAMGICAAMVVPVEGPAGTVASLNLGFAEVREFTESDRRLARAYADQASAALQRALAYEREREAAERVRELDRIKSDFLSTVSHELRTPLTGITGFGETLLERWDQLGDEIRHELLRRMTAAAAELDRLLSDLIDVSRLERGAIPSLEVLDLRVEVHRVAGRLSSVLERHHLQLDVPPGTMALAETRSCGQVLANLIGNAAKFSPSGSTIRVSARTEGSDVVVSVSDEGVGIAPDDIPRIFDRFYRVEAGSAGPPGTGMGLTIARESVQAMGGRLWAESQVGKGSVFSFTLRRPPERHMEPSSVRVSSRSPD